MRLRDLEVGFELEFSHDMKEKDILKALELLAPSPNGKRRRDRYFVTYDGSVRCNNSHTSLEIITPVWPFATALKNLQTIFDFMALTGAEVNASCGLHVNMGFIDKMNAKKIDRLKLVLLSNEEKWLKVFGRTSNGYCVPFVKRMKDNYTNYRSWRRYATSTIDDPKTFIITREKASSEKYDAVNRVKLPRKKFVEFRVIGNKNYHFRHDEVVEAIKDFAYAMLDSTTSKRNRTFETALNEASKRMIPPPKVKITAPTILSRAA